MVCHTCISLHLAGRPDPCDDLQAGLAIRHQLDKTRYQLDQMYAEKVRLWVVM